MSYLKETGVCPPGREDRLSYVKTFLRSFGAPFVLFRYRSRTQETVTYKVIVVETPEYLAPFIPKALQFRSLSPSVRSMFPSSVTLFVTANTKATKLNGLFIS